MSYPKYVVTYRHAETGERMERDFDDPEDADKFLRTLDDGRCYILDDEEYVVEDELF